MKWITGKLVDFHSVRSIRKKVSRFASDSRSNWRTEVMMPARALLLRASAGSDTAMSQVLGGSFAYNR